MLNKAARKVVPSKESALRAQESPRVPHEGKRKQFVIRLTREQRVKLQRIAEAEGMLNGYPVFMSQVIVKYVGEGIGRYEKTHGRLEG